MFRKSLISLFLRGFSLGSKFILLYFMARNMSPEDLGIYGVISVTIAFTIYILGFDFYIFNTRELLSVVQLERSKLIKDQFVFHLCSYVIVLPLLLTVFLTGYIPWRFLGLFYILLLLDHMSQEFYRIFITLSQVVVANVTLFLRSGLWVYVVVTYGYFNQNARSLECILSGWICGEVLSIVISVYVISRLDWTDVRAMTINWSWIRTGLKRSSVFFLATIGLKIIECSDRFFIQHYHKEAMVGVYTFYASIANVLQIFVFTGVISVLFPKVVEAYQRKNESDYVSLMKQMSLISIGTVIVLSVLAVVGIKPVLMLIGKQIYIEYLPVFWLLIASVGISVIGNIPHYDLFVRKFDKAILGCTVCGVVTSLVGNLLLVPRFGIVGAGMSSVISMSVIVLGKGFIVVRLNQRCNPRSLELLKQGMQ